MIYGDYKNIPTLNDVNICDCCSWRGARVAECGGLENRSHPVVFHVELQAKL